MQIPILLKNINIHKSFNKFIFDEKNIKDLINIEKKLPNFLYKNTKISNINNYFFPYSNNVFRFLENDITKIKYIILGMEPYSSYYIHDNKIIPISTGRSFEVDNLSSFKNNFKQSSLITILKTLYYNKYNKKINISQLKNKIIEIDKQTSNTIIKKIKDKHFIENKKNLLKETIKNEILITLNLSQNDILKLNANENIILFNPKSFFDITELQGILWLNATLTTKPNISNAHTKLWNEYMSNLLKYLTKQNENIKFLLFGEVAKNRVSNIVKKENMIITCHPASRVNNNFIESNCFKHLTNILLYL